MTKYRIDPDALRYACRRAGYVRVGAGKRSGSVVVHRLAKASGVPAKTISAYLAPGRRNPSASHLIQLADALDVDPRDLMIEEDK